ncbi:Uncharacterised protein [Mycobacteroides abscessus]|nr:Uncharacterised protein [Mycobacteroides abscessus]
MLVLAVACPAPSTTRASTSAAVRSGGLTLNVGS